MKTLDLEIYNVQELNLMDTIKIDGGTDNPAYNAGHAAGVLAREVVDDLIFAALVVGKWFE